MSEFDGEQEPDEKPSDADHRSGGRDDRRSGGTGDRSEEERESDDENVYTAPKLTEGIDEVLARPREWFFLLENRLVIAGGILLVFFVVVLSVDVLLGVGAGDLQPLFYVFSGLIGGNLTLITIVISINQLVVSRHMNTPGGLREEIQGVNEYRESVEEALSREVAPVTPSDFLQMLLESTQQGIEQAKDHVDDIGDEEARERVSELLEDMGTNIRHTDHVLRQSDVGIFEALSVTLRTNYAREIYEIRDIQTSYGEGLSPELGEVLDDLVVRVQQIDVARQYFKTLYLQDELSYLSRILLYAGVPAEFVSIGMLLLFAGGVQFPLPWIALSVLIPVAITVATAPLVVLFAFILRISIVAQRTAAITPFTTANQEGPRELVEIRAEDPRFGD